MELATAAKLSVTVLKEARDFLSKYVETPKKNDDTLPVHIVFTEAWSSSVSIFGMSKPFDIDLQTLPLKITNQPRRFFSNDKRTEVEENIILTSNASIVILGDPGCGKTTLMKRLIRHYIVEAPSTEDDQIEFPMLVLGRDINNDHTLMDDLFDKLGFSLKADIISSAHKQKEWRIRKNAEVTRAVLNTLSRAKVAVFIDGIDEMDINVRANFHDDMEKLANSLGGGRVIATCRSGDWAHVSSLELYEICPLKQDEVEAIINMCSDDPKAFIRQIERIPYKDILNRPLFITMLIVLFNQTGKLSDQPVEIYQRVTNVLLEKWDLQRDIKRTTRYDNFLTERKYRFLCAMAFATLVGIRKQRFSSNELHAAYKTVHRAFGLPQDDASYVVKEIESHTGLIVESGFDHFEFSHLTIHEFLCAQHLISMSDFRQACHVIEVSPAAVAVATCLASDPSRYLGLVLWNYIKPYSDDPGRYYGSIQAIDSALARLALEQPVLVPSPILGAALLKVMSLYDYLYQTDLMDLSTTKRLDNLSVVLSTTGMLESIELAMTSAASRQEIGYLEVRGGPRAIEGIEFGKDVVVKLSRVFINALNKRASIPVISNRNIA